MNDGSCTLAERGDLTLLRKERSAFVLLSAALSWPLMIPVWSALPADFAPGDREMLEAAFGNWLMLFGAGPMLAAIAVVAWFRGRAGLAELFGRVVRLRFGAHWYLLAFAFPLLYQWPAAWLWGWVAGETIDYPPLASYLSSWLQISVVSALYFITEELGWRGFLLPRVLAKHSWIKAALVVGVIWSVWHYPYWLTASWGVTGDMGEAAMMALSSTVFSCALSVMLTWLFQNTKGSVFIAMLFHGSNNANMEKVFAAAGDAAHSLGFLLARSTTTAVVAAVLIVLVTRFRR